jgi:choline dehydrogenase-like flavoprotein
MKSILTDGERSTLAALCNALLPSLEAHPGDDAALFGESASSRGVPGRVEETLAILPAGDLSRFRLFLRLLDQPAFMAFRCGRLTRFSALTQLDAEKALASMATSRLPDLRAGFQAIRRLATFHYFSAITGRKNDPVWRALGYTPSANPESIPASLVLTYIDSDSSLDCDACIVGSGGGGSVVAAELAARGLNVLVLESGSGWQSEEFDQREEPGTKELYLDRGTTSTRDLALSIFAGACVGGGTTVNWQTSLRTPDDVRREWAESSGCAHFASESFTQSLDAVWNRLSIGTAESKANANNRALRDGCRALGYDWSVTPRNSRGCDLSQCGYCVYGCRHGGKQTAGATYLVDAQRSGSTRIIARCHVDIVTISNGKVTGLNGTLTRSDGSCAKLSVNAKIVVAACGSLHTAALLLRSGVNLPEIGRNLFLHPTTAVGALFDHPVEAWMGAPQTVVCNEFANLRGGYGFRVETAPAHPGLVALATPWLSARSHRRVMQSTQRKALLIALVRDRSTGRVTIDRAGRPVVDYRPGKSEMEMLREGMCRTARILHAAGATGVQTLHTRPLTIGESSDDSARFPDIDALCSAIMKSRVGSNHVGLFSAHQMGTCRMGRDPRSAVCDECGEVFGVRGLYIGDASAFPLSSGVNPMVTIMAMAHHTARRIEIR